MALESSVEKSRSNRKVFEGLVVSDKMTKTRIVSVERLTKHRFYEKVMRKNSRFVVHDEEGASKLGDLVEVMSCRPISKTKRWRLVRIVKKAPAGYVAANQKEASVGGIAG